MYFNVSDEDKNKSGVYGIYNKLKDRTYYGSTKDFNARYDTHIKLLKYNNHFNKFLQYDFFQTGFEHFEFKILKITTLNERTIMEQIYLDDFYDYQEKCYNFSKNAIREERSCYSLTPEETSKKKSDSCKSEKRMKVFNENCHSSEAHAKIGAAKAKTYLFINPMGKVIEITNLNKFCNENSLLVTCMSAVIFGKCPSHKGCRKYHSDLVGVIYKRNRCVGEKSFKIKSPFGEIIETTNITQFCKKHNLSRVALARVISRKIECHRGWTRTD